MAALQPFRGGGKWSDLASACGAASFRAQAILESVLGTPTHLETMRGTLQQQPVI